MVYDLCLCQKKIQVYITCSCDIAICNHSGPWPTICFSSWFYILPGWIIPVEFSLRILIYAVVMNYWLMYSKYIRKPLSAQIKENASWICMISFYTILIYSIWMKCMTNIIVEDWKSISIRPQNTCLSFGLTYPISLSEILRSWVFLPFALVRW